MQVPGLQVKASDLVGQLLVPLGRGVVKDNGSEEDLTSSAMVPESPPSAPLTGLLVGYIHSHFYV